MMLNGDINMKDRYEETDKSITKWKNDLSFRWRMWTYNQINK